MNRNYMAIFLDLNDLDQFISFLSRQTKIKVAIAEVGNDRDTFYRSRERGMIRLWANLKVSKTGIISRTIYAC